MPNTGQFSRRCYSCRQRHCKCDLARPSCGQCLRAGKTCSGYRDDVSMRFRIINHSSFQPGTRRQNRKIRYEDPPMVEESSTEESDTPSVQIIYEPSQVWSHHVIPLVLDKFTVDLVDTRIDSSMFATIPRIISRTNEGSSVYSVCNAIACAYLATTTGTTAATVNRARAYGTALKTVNQALNDPVECKSDSTLLAIWMFVVYEFLSNPHLTSIAGSEEGDRHCRGMASLIRLRGSEQFSRQDGRNLIWFVCHCTQAKALVAGRESPEEVLGWIQELSQSMKGSEYILVQACTFAYHCTRLLCQIRNVLTGNLDLALTTYSSIMQQMNETERLWSSSYDSAPPSISSIGVHAYQGNFRMRVSAGLLAFLDRASDSNLFDQPHMDFKAIQERCTAAFRATATSILSLQGIFHGRTHPPSDRLNLGWGDAVMIYGSLRTIAVSPISLDWQRNAAIGVCAIIKERLGFQLLI
ncbi:hypothetical protein N7513_005668 [Penicillium frequentans]|nr:hypothetical protein N7513_005668 [Penicillium glabrum]